MLIFEKENLQAVRPREWVSSKLRKGEARRGLWTFVDQLISSGTNFAVGLSLARVLGPREYGSFALTFAAWIVLMSTARSMIVQPYVVTASPLAGTPSWSRATQAASSVIVVGGVLGGFVVFVLASVLPATFFGSAGPFVALGVFAGPLLLQDFWRFAGFSQGRAVASAVNDLTWAVTLVILLAALWSTHRLTATSGMAAWGMGATVAALVGTVQFRCMPRFNKEARQWLRSIARLGGWFGLSSAVYTAGNQAALFVVGSIVGRGAVGGLRSVQNVFAPAQLVSMSAELFALPEVARAASTHHMHRFRKMCIAYGGLLAAFMCMWTIALTAGGERALRVVFGDAFVPFADIILPIGLAGVFGLIAGGATLGLRATQAGSRLAATQVIGTGIRLPMVVSLTILFGLKGAAWGFACGSLFHAVAAWSTLLRLQSKESRLESP